MIRASGLYGRAVIDLDTAERIGEVDEIIVDPYGPGIAGYVVACERSLFGSRKRIIIPIEAFHAIGPDALTMRSAGAPGYHTAHLDSLPRLSELTGRPDGQLRRPAARLGRGRADLRAGRADHRLSAGAGRPGHLARDGVRPRLEV